MRSYPPVPSNQRCTGSRCSGRLYKSSRKAYRKDGLWECTSCSRLYQNKKSPLSTKPETHRPLTIFDRVQAVLRNSDYLQEVQAYLKTIDAGVCTSNSLVGNPVDKRWGVPDGTLLAVMGQQPERTPSIFADGYARRSMVKDVRGANLTIEIDLTLPAHESLRIAASEIAHYQRLMGLDSGTRKRNRPTEVDPWFVYDLHRRAKQKQSLPQITRRIFQIKGNPATDSAFARRHRQVERAYRKAVQLIRSVEPPAS